MVSMHSHISWTDTTFNPTTGCTKVSAGCDHCYAEALTNRLWGGDFGTVKLHPNRLSQAGKFTPIRQADGSLLPRRLFVNSMSDLMHDAIPDAFRDRVFDVLEAMPLTIAQVLTKRPMTLKRYISARYPNGVPDHIWLGVSVEDNKVAGRIDQLRRLKDAVGDYTAFLSVEPLIGPCDRHDYRCIDWVLIGGEFGHKARPMELGWARTSRDLARAAGAATWFKQFGTWVSNPLYRESNAPRHIDRVRHAIAQGELQASIEIENGRETIHGEKGGATLDGEVLHEHPPSYERVRATLNHAPARDPAFALA